MDRDTLLGIGFFFVLPITLIVCGFVSMSILRSKKYSGCAGFALGYFGGIIGIIIAYALPENTQSVLRVSPRTPATSSGSYSSSSPSTYDDDDDDNYDPRNDWNSLSGWDQANLMRDMERREEEV